MITRIALARASSAQRRVATTGLLSRLPTTTTTTAIKANTAVHSLSTMVSSSSLPTTATTTSIQELVVAMSSDRRYFSDEKKVEEEEATAAAAEEAEEEKSDDKEKETSSESKEEESPKVSKEEELTLKVKELEDRLLRSLAEQENTRQIAKRDIQSARDYSIKSFAKSLLEVSDNLSRALDAVPEEARTDKENNSVLANLYEGIVMTDNGLEKAFASNGLKKFSQEPGEVFDPERHQALFEYEDKSKEPGTVGQVMKVGFSLNDRVLRPAEVGVIKKT